MAPGLSRVRTACLVCRPPSPMCLKVLLAVKPAEGVIKAQKMRWVLLGVVSYVGVSVSRDNAVPLIRCVRGKFCKHTRPYGWSFGTSASCASPGRTVAYESLSRCSPGGSMHGYTTGRFAYCAYPCTNTPVGFACNRGLQSCFSHVSIISLIHNCILSLVARDVQSIELDNG